MTCDERLGLVSIVDGKYILVAFGSISLKTERSVFQQKDEYFSASHTAHVNGQGKEGYFPQYVFFKHGWRLIEAILDVTRLKSVLSGVVSGEKETHFSSRIQQHHTINKGVEMLKVQAKKPWSLP